MYCESDLCVVRAATSWEFPAQPVASMAPDPECVIGPSSARPGFLETPKSQQKWRRPGFCLPAMSLGRWRSMGWWWRCGGVRYSDKILYWEGFGKSNTLITMTIIEDASKTCSNDHSDDYNFKRRDHQPWCRQQLLDDPVHAVFGTFWLLIVVYTSTYIFLIFDSLSNIYTSQLICPWVIVTLSDSHTAAKGLVRCEMWDFWSEWGDMTWPKILTYLQWRSFIFPWGAVLETCDLCDLSSEWCGDMIWPKMLPPFPKTPFFDSAPSCKHTNNKQTTIMFIVLIMLIMSIMSFFILFISIVTVALCRLCQWLSLFSPQPHRDQGAGSQFAK